jgi:membrane associated rhomboid family serine protease/Flp pilus assembly protein TadD
MRSPPPLAWLPRYPVTGTTGTLALGVTLAWWAGADIAPLGMSAGAWRGELWRLVTSALPHVDPLHLAFNLYWLWAFGTLVEGAFGRLRTAAIFLLLAAGSAAAEYAVYDGGVGLSGVGYGLFGLLWVLSARKDSRFAGAIDHRTVVLFLGWFVLCFVLTQAGAWRVGNVAHAAGGVLGILLGLAVAARGQQRLFFAASVGLATFLIVLSATAARPYLNRSETAGDELAYLGYRALEEGRNEDAVSLYHQALALKGNQAGWWYNLGIGCQRLERHDEAVAAYQHAVDCDPHDASYRQALASGKARLAYERQTAGQLDEAARLYQEALALDDREALYWFDLGLVQQQLGRTKQATEAFERAAALDPANKSYRPALGKSHQTADEP